MVLEEVGSLLKSIHIKGSDDGTFTNIETLCLGRRTGGDVSLGGTVFIFINVLYELYNSCCPLSNMLKMQTRNCRQNGDSF